jgi:fructose-bisphosphate aldolase class I
VMDIQALKSTAKAMMADKKGLLAMDESNGTCNKRFAKLGIPETPELRCAYREMIVTTPDLYESISGVILFDETIHQHLADGTPFIKALTDQGIIPGIKVDKKAKDMAGFAGEKITEGLDGLRNRLKKYAEMGLRFAKWRAVITIGQDIPSRACVKSNVQALARYAALCQEAGLVPIVEPEVLMKGDHTLQQTFDVTEEVLIKLFLELHQQKVMLEGLILKVNMVIPGVNCPVQATVDEVAEATVKGLLRTVPAATAGVAFLSGGQSGELACERLNAMHVKYESRLPWPLTFSFARAIQKPALSIWQGESSMVEEAQQALYHRAHCSQAARVGKYDFAKESTMLIKAL